ncbi:MAG TPA: hypothetical protein VMR81_06950 [Patescibacteria group bacterium]|nr:hypothetical protein [Patescibacteria group bacterium]
MKQKQFRKLFSFLARIPQDIIITTVSLFVTLFSYWNISKLYYLNDEWAQLGIVKVNGLYASLQSFSLLDILMGNGRVFGTVINNIFFRYFPLNPWPFAIIAFIFHPINSLLVYKISKKLTSNTWISLISWGFFLTCSVSHQALSELTNPVQVLISTFFVLLSLNIFIEYMRTEKGYQFIVSWLCAYTAFLFKDSTMYTFILLPILFVIFYSGKRKLITFVKLHICQAIIMIVTAVSRVIGYYGSPGINAVAIVKIPLWMHFSNNIIMYPLASLSQFLIPYRFMYKIVPWFVRINYPVTMVYVTDPNVVYDLMASDFIAVILSFVLIFLFAYSLFRGVIKRKTALVLGVLYILNFMPIAAFLPWKNASYMESRYLYAIAVPASIIFGSIFYSLFQFIQVFTKRKIEKVILIICAVLFLCLFFVKQISIIRREVYANVIRGNNTKNVVSQLTRMVPTLPDKPVIYIGGEGNYGHFNQKVPLELGPGYVIMTLYYDQGKIPKSLINQVFLETMASQGYKESEGKGFGYFWDKNQLLELIKNNTISIDQVVALNYSTRDSTFTNITKSFKEDALKQFSQ